MPRVGDFFELSDELVGLDAVEHALGRDALHSAVVKSLEQCVVLTEEVAGCHDGELDLLFLRFMLTDLLRLASEKGGLGFYFFISFINARLICLRTDEFIIIELLRHDLRTNLFELEFSAFNNVDVFRWRSFFVNSLIIFKLALFKE